MRLLHFKLEALRIFRMEVLVAPLQLAAAAKRHGVGICGNTTSQCRRRAVTAIYCMFGRVSWQLLRPSDEDRLPKQRRMRRKQSVHVSPDPGSKPQKYVK